MFNKNFVPHLIAGVLALALAAGGTAAKAGSGVFGSDYTAHGKCGPFARAAVTTPAWGCLGIVAGPADDLIMPRNVIELSPGHLLLIDMGGWAKNRGRLLELTLGADGSRMFKTLLAQLDRPHGLALGPDGKVYVGEAKTIWRFAPTAPAIEREILLSDLPDTGRHPLKHFVFDVHGDLIVNMGAPSDHCEADGKAALVAYPCPAVEGDKPLAAIYRLHFDRPGGKVVSFAPIARGLRNSMAMAVEPKTGLLVQGENNIDYPDENDPPEELNVVVEGKNYGWPYCTDRGQVVRQYRGKVTSCAPFANPAALMPAHGAPLGMLYYHGAMFPELEGKLLVGFHGYRNNGHRLLAYDRLPDGTPIEPSQTASKGRQPNFPFPSFPLEVITGWDDRPGVRPMGAPVTIAEGADGRIWFTEDRNRTLMVFLRGAAAADAASSGASQVSQLAAEAVQPPPPAWTRLSQTISPVCSQCHEDFRARSPADIWANLVRHHWVTQGDLRTSLIVRAMQGEPPLKPMPPAGGIGTLAGGQAALNAFLAKP